VSSRLSVDDLGDLFGIDLDDHDVETVGGLLASASAGFATGGGSRGRGP